jgi:rare lipoprotein A (peptidoglycan hydrolase)
VPLLLCGALLFVPLLVSRSRHDTTAKVVTTEQSQQALAAERTALDRSSRSVSRAHLEEAAAVLVETTVPPTTEPPTTSTTVRRTTTTTRVVVKAAAPKTTTTTAKPKPTTTTTRPPNQQTGQASWYDAPDGTCAHRTLAFGTILTVTNLANGAKVTCRVADRGPYVQGRIVDLAKTSFDDLASPSAGVIDVRIEW